MRATERGLQPHAMHLRDAVLLAVWAGAARVLGAARPRVWRVPQREEEGERSWAGGVGPRRGARGRRSRAGARGCCGWRGSGGGNCRGPCFGHQAQALESKEAWPGVVRAGVGSEKGVLLVGSRTKTSAAGRCPCPLTREGEERRRRGLLWGCYRYLF